MIPVEPPPWADGCLLDLMRILVDGEQSLMAAWIAVHCGVDEDAWDEFVIAAGSMAATSFEALARSRGLVNDDDEIVFAPLHRASAEQIERDAGLLVTMLMNEDAPGVRGVLVASHGRGDFEELCGAVCILAAAALRAEAVLLATGGPS